MRKSLYIIIIFLSIVLNGYAQNLVPNYSFENYSSCPDNFSQINRAIPWYDPTTGSSDYYNSCDAGFMNVPFCGAGYQYSKTGFGHAGLWALNGFGDGSREYIQIQLTSSLIADSCYTVGFYCNLDNNVGYAVSTLGAYLSDTAISYTGSGSMSVLNYSPQIVSDTFLIDTLGWMYVSGYYQAQGGEKFITLGNFKFFNAADTLYVGGGSYPGAYYMIDDVTVVKTPNCDTTLGVGEISSSFPFSISPNPNNGAMSFQYIVKHGDKAVVKLYDLTGKIIMEKLY